MTITNTVFAFVPNSLPSIKRIIHFRAMFWWRRWRGGFFFQDLPIHIKMPVSASIFCFKFQLIPFSIKIIGNIFPVRPSTAFSMKFFNFLSINPKPGIIINTQSCFNSIFINIIYIYFFFSIKNRSARSFFASILFPI